MLLSRLFAYTFGALFSALAFGFVNAAPVDVAVAAENGSAKLLRKGQPYFVKGVGGDATVETLVNAGGNSFRTWGDEKLDEQLATAEKLGLTVTAGIWLGQVRQGFDWSDAAGLERQMEHVRATVEKHKNSSALLIWALGNEMEDSAGNNASVWLAINNLARMVKQIDPRHPVMTVIAEIGGQKVRNLHRFCPDLDMVGINSYAGAPSLAERYKKAGGTKPYIVTEFGPPGIWEVRKNEIGAYPEPTSTEKAEIYRRIYKSAVIGESSLCLGSYAFLWGQKQEATATWFSMFLKDGTRLGAVDAMQELWSGKPPANKSPTIASMKLEGAESVEPGATVKVSLQAADPESDPIKAEWIVQRDAEEFGSGGDNEQAPPTFPKAVVTGDIHGAEILMPKEGGLYRLFAIVRNDHGGGAVANVPVRVKGEAPSVAARKAKLPLTIYEEDGAPLSYVPAGWMGDAKAIKVDPGCADKPHSGKTCMRCDFTAANGWGGVVWQSPENDWGDRSGGFDLTGAKQISFWARGDKGGEVVTFKFGIIPHDKRFFDTAQGQSEPITLTPEWKQYSIAVTGKDLSRIKTGFVWTLAASGSPITFYLDDVVWE